MLSPFAISPLATAAVAAGTLGPGTPAGAFRGGSGEESLEEEAPLGSTGIVDDGERLPLLAKAIEAESRPTSPRKRSAERFRGPGCRLLRRR